VRPAGGPQRAVVEPTTALFLGLLFVGLTSIGLAVWFLTMQHLVGGRSAAAQVPLSGTPVTAPQAGILSRRASAAQTQKAQEAEIARLQDELEHTQAELAAARARLAATPLPGSTHLDKPPLALILDVPVFKQQRPLSCESSAAAMAANFFGVPIGEQDILAALPRHENPHLGFRGNIDGTYGGTDDYGVYAEPIRQVLANLGLEAQHLSGGTDEIRQQIRQGRPVIAWVTYGMQAETPTQVQLSDGQLVTLVPYEHTVVVVGYNRDGLWVNDPYAGTQDFYTEGDFVRSFAYLGNMGLVVGPPVAQ
jgi:uncharacterized protein YvpB